MANNAAATTSASPTAASSMSSALSSKQHFASPSLIMNAKMAGRLQGTKAGRTKGNVDLFKEDIGTTFPFKQYSAYRGGSSKFPRNRN